MGSSTASGAGAKTLSWADAVKLNYAPRSVTLVNIAKGGTTTYAGLPTSSAPVAGRPAPDPTANVDAALARSPKLVLVAYPFSAAVAPCFVAVREALAGPDGKLNPIYDSGDGEHPNDAGHAVIASKVEG